MVLVLLPSLPLLSLLLLLLLAFRILNPQTERFIIERNMLCYGMLVFLKEKDDCTNSVRPIHSLIGVQLLAHRISTATLPVSKPRSTATNRAPCSVHLLSTIFTFYFCSVISLGRTSLRLLSL